MAAHWKETRTVTARQVIGITVERYPSASASMIFGAGPYSQALPRFWTGAFSLEV